MKKILSLIMIITISLCLFGCCKKPSNQVVNNDHGNNSSKDMVHEKKFKYSTNISNENDSYEFVIHDNNTTSFFFEGAHEGYMHVKIDVKGKYDDNLWVITSYSLKYVFLEKEIETTFDLEEDDPNNHDTKYNHERYRDNIRREFAPYKINDGVYTNAFALRNNTIFYLDGTNIVDFFAILSTNRVRGYEHDIDYGKTIHGEYLFGNSGIDVNYAYYYIQKEGENYIVENLDLIKECNEQKPTLNSENKVNIELNRDNKKIDTTLNVRKQDVFEYSHIKIEYDPQIDVAGVPWSKVVDSMNDSMNNKIFVVAKDYCVDIEPDSWKNNNKLYGESVYIIKPKDASKPSLSLYITLAAKNHIYQIEDILNSNENNENTFPIFRLNKGQYKPSSKLNTIFKLNDATHLNKIFSQFAYITDEETPSLLIKYKSFFEEIKEIGPSFPDHSIENISNALKISIKQFVIIPVLDIEKTKFDKLIFNVSINETDDTYTLEYRNGDKDQPKNYLDSKVVNFSGQDYYMIKEKDKNGFDYHFLLEKNN